VYEWCVKHQPRIILRPGLFFVHISRPLINAKNMKKRNWKVELSLVCFLAHSSFPALINKGLFELTRQPLVTQAVSSSTLSFVNHVNSSSFIVFTKENPGGSQMFSPNYDRVLCSFSGKCDETDLVNQTCQVCSKCPLSGKGRREGKCRDTRKTLFKCHVQPYFFFVTEKSMA